MTPKDRIGIQEVADILGVAVNTLQRKKWRKKKGIPIFKFGRSLVSYQPLINQYITEKWQK